MLEGEIGREAKCGCSTYFVVCLAVMSWREVWFEDMSRWKFMLQHRKACWWEKNATVCSCDWLSDVDGQKAQESR